MARRAAWVICAVLMTAGCSGGGNATKPATPATSGVSTAVGSSSDPFEITTDLGVVRGAPSAVDGVRAFLSIPYAAPPIGDNRWRAPQPRVPYRGVLDATVAGQSCPQDTSTPAEKLIKVPPTTEDCLTLSVWAPADATDVPVMVFIHGGGLIGGSAHQPLYTGDHLAARGVVVIDINYRLGVLGFLATEELARESDDSSFGNYGFADQIEALRWVQRNVTGFGGNPGHVTIFGQSSGGTSVCAHLVSPASKGLFERAIIESGIDCGALQPKADAQAAGAALLASVGCSDVACLRAKPTADLVGAVFEPTFVADGVRLPSASRPPIVSTDIPVLVGANAEDARIFTVTTPEPSDDELLALAADFTKDPAALVALYPKADYPSNLERYRTMFTDARYVCPTIGFAQAADNPTYIYYFTYTTPTEPLGLGPTHGAELGFVFAHPEGVLRGPATYDGTDAAVSATVQAAWVQFATEGTPGDQASWRLYRDGAEITQIDASLSLVPTIRDGRCDQVNALTAP